MTHVYGSAYKFDADLVKFLCRSTKMGNLRAVQVLLGHAKVDSTVHYLGVELEDALIIAERIDI